MAALARRQPGPGDRAALRCARPGRRPGRGGAARRLVDHPGRASGAGGTHRRGRLASAVCPHRPGQPGRAPARDGLAGPVRADRGPTLPARQRPPLLLGSAADGDPARGPGRAAAAVGPTGDGADHPPPSPHNERPSWRLWAGGAGPGTGRRRWRPARAPQCDLESGRVQPGPTGRCRPLAGRPGAGRVAGRRAGGRQPRDQSGGDDRVGAAGRGGQAPRGGTVLHDPCDVRPRHRPPQRVAARAS